MRTERLLTAVTLSLAVLLAGCDRNNTTAGNGAEEDLPYERVNGRLMGDLTLLGTVAGTDLRPFVSVCAQDSPEDEYDPLCSATDSNGNYRMLGLFSSSGLLESRFNDRFGRERQLFGLFDLTVAGNEADARSNVTPLGNVASQAYTIGRASVDADTCFNGPDSASCAESLDGGLNLNTLNRIQDNLSDWLAPIWPEGDNSSAIVAVYSDDEQANPWIEFHRTIDLSTRFDEDTEQYLAEARALPTGGNCGDQVLATAKLSDLNLTSLPEDVDRLTSEELASELEGCAVSSPRSSMAPFQVTASPSHGQAPLLTEIAIALTTGNSISEISAQLLNPRGQLIDAWTVQETQLTLDDVGTYRIAVDAVVDNQSATAGLAIPVASADNGTRVMSWGLSGSCRAPDNAVDLTNLRNVCLEKLDGSMKPPAPEVANCDALTERPELSYSPGVCSQTDQYNEPLLGICAQPGSDTRIFHYRDPITSETRRQQHDRLENTCTGLRGGEWDSRL